jgi:hypothetical protein
MVEWQWLTTATHIQVSYLMNNNNCRLPLTLLMEQHTVSQVYCCCALQSSQHVSGTATAHFTARFFGVRTARTVCCLLNCKHQHVYYLLGLCSQVT